jgi:hypothetical protein
MKKMAALAVLAMMAALASAQPAVAGVGGCKIVGVGGCGGWALTVSGSQPQDKTPSVLDSLNAALPADVVAFLKVMFEQKNDTPTVIEAPQAPTTSGVGGCGGRIGMVC